MDKKDEMLWIAVVKRDAPTRSSAWTQMMLDEILFGQIRLEPVIEPWKEKSRAESLEREKRKKKDRETKSQSQRTEEDRGRRR